MRKDWRIKFAIQAILAQVLYFAIRLLFLLLWPTGSSLSSDVVAIPFAVLPMIIVPLATLRMVWRRQEDGPYVETKLLRGIWTGLLLSVVMVYLLLAVVVVLGELLDRPDLRPFNM
jgi:hypothetical protein